VDLEDRVIVVTGAGSGIGEALARRFATERPRGLVVADIDLEGLGRVASELAADPVQIDVADPEANRALVEHTERTHGPIDLFCANAGYGIIGDEQTDPGAWDRMWQVNVMSHVHAARYLVPGWLARGEGYFLATVSAAGLLTNLKAAQYSVTKHAALAFSEWLAVTYGDQGIRVSCLCPMGVRTRLLDVASEFEALLGPAAIQPEEVAEAAVRGLADERFLILPHPEVEGYFQNKANDYDRWLGGMRKVQRAVFPSDRR
jgi:NAD(P)-dependent dehydrogenase (short-subunit alcohol dehydrogenase family)